MNWLGEDATGKVRARGLQVAGNTSDCEVLRSTSGGRSWESGSLKAGPQGLHAPLFALWLGVCVGLLWTFPGCQQLEDAGVRVRVLVKRWAPLSPAFLTFEIGRAAHTSQARACLTAQERCAGPPLQ